MLFDFTRRRAIVLWQLLFLLLSTTWLWAPHLNSRLFYKTALISQYEIPFQPFAWVFRTGDVLAAVLLMLMAVAYLKLPGKRTAGWLLLIIGLGLLADPLFPTTCHTLAGVCQEYVSPSSIAHGIETALTAASLLILVVYDAWLRKKLVSVTFAIFQIGLGISALLLNHLGDKQRFDTVFQYAYQTVLLIWLAWFGRDFLLEQEFAVRLREVRLVTIVAAVWAFLNGILAIVVSLAHIHLLGRIKGLYFAGDSAWLAQHGVIIGVVMLYLSRHLARGERRARQVFLLITGVETLKYSVITPNPALLLLYFVTFMALFVLRDDFERGTIALTWQVRLRELYFMLGALLSATLVSLLLLDRDNRVSRVANRTFDNFFDYVTSSRVAGHGHLRSVLLAHTISAFLIASAAAIMWILFRPYKHLQDNGRNYQKVEQVLKRYATSSEDFFKLWPADKDYFWQPGGEGFIAYKVVGSTAFALADPMTGRPEQLLTDFIAWCKARRLRPCLLPIYEASLPLYQAAGLETLQIGSSALVAIQTFLTQTANDKWWRWQRNRATKSGCNYAVSSAPHAAAFLQQLRAVSDAWLAKDGDAKDKVAERNFAQGYFDEPYLQRCTIHYLHDAEGRILAFTNQLPSFRPTETATIDLLRYLPDAPGAMPFLLFKLLEQLEADRAGYRFFDLGFVPFARAKGPILTIARTLNTSFSAKGLEQFKNKFKPDWRPNYMAYDGDLADLAAIALNLEKTTEQKP